MNKKKIIGAGVGLVTAGFRTYKLLRGNEPPKYSSEWFETVSDEVLETEREVVRKRYCSAGYDFSLADRMYRLLNRFDSVINKRAWGDEIPHGPSYHREHGYNLYKAE